MDKNLNTWDLNTWDLNTWYRNTWNFNTWDRNTWYLNTWNLNTWYRNAWNLNTWNRNTWNRNTWYLNTISLRDWYLFNKIVSNLFDEDWNCTIQFPEWFFFDLISSNWTDSPCLWIPEIEMTEEEKKKNETYKTTWWYIKVWVVDEDMKTHWRSAFDNCNSLEDLRKTLELPNFDYDIFEEISGISKQDFDEKLWTDNIIGKEISIMIDWVEHIAIIKKVL